MPRCFFDLHLANIVLPELCFSFRSEREREYGKRKRESERERECVRDL
jgi:hypothetical protein